MKKSILIIALVAATGSIFAQKKTTTSATIGFDATTSLDQLPKADNKTVIAALDTKKGTVAFESIIKNFTFANPKMQEHFNGANWMDSEKFPTDTFKWNITNPAAVNFGKDGTYTAEIAGDLTIHGVTKPVKTIAKIAVTGKSMSATTDFSIKLEDYGINGQAIAAGKVSKEPKISVIAVFN
jgi:polyisoprenoid-binding protein YceI